MVTKINITVTDIDIKKYNKTDFNKCMNCLNRLEFKMRKNFFSNDHDICGPFLLRMLQKKSSNLIRE